MKSPRRLPGIAWLLAPLPFGAGLVLFVVLSRGGGDPEVVSKPLPELPASVISIPMTYDGRELVTELDTRIPTRLGGLAFRQTYPSDPRLQYAFEARRGAFEFAVRGDTVDVTTEVRYGGQVWYATPLGVQLTPSCGIADGAVSPDAPRAILRLSVILALGEDWTLDPEVQVRGVEPRTNDDRCRVSVLQFQVDATETIMSAVRAWLEEETTVIQAAMDSIGTRPDAQEGWAKLSEPLSLAPDAWLLLNPVGVGYQLEGGQGGAIPEIHGRIFVTASPVVVVGDAPDAAAGALPPLRSARGGAARWISIETRAAPEHVSELLTQRLAGTEWRVLGTTLRVKAITVSGTEGGRAALDIELAGDVSGHLHVMGTPVFDPEAAELTLPDLEFALETDHAIARLAGWLIRKGFMGRLRRRARLPVDGLLADYLEVPTDVNISLSRQATLEGAFVGAEVTDVAATRDALIVRARIQPEVTLRLGP